MRASASRNPGACSLSRRYQRPRAVTVGAAMAGQYNPIQADHRRHTRSAPERHCSQMDILVLYYSRHGATRRLADLIATGIDGVSGTQARLRTVPPVAATVEVAAPPVPPSGSPYVEVRD